MTTERETSPAKRARERVAADGRRGSARKAVVHTRFEDLRSSRKTLARMRTRFGSFEPATTFVVARSERARARAIAP